MSKEQQGLLDEAEDDPYSTFSENQNRKRKNKDEDLDDEDELDNTDILAIQKGGKPLRYHFYNQVNKMVSTSFGLISALAWNEAIKALFIEVYGPGSAETTISLFIYAVIVTILVVLVVFYVGRLAQIVEDFDRKTSQYVKKQKVKIKQKLQRSRSAKKNVPPTSDSQTVQ